MSDLDDETADHTHMRRSEIQRHKYSNISKRMHL